MKTSVTYLSILLCLVVYTSCNGGNNSNGTANVPLELNNETNAGGDAATFIKEAAKGGFMEVALGKMAQQHSQDPAVKSFGAMMIKDHSQINEEIKRLAEKYKVVIPDAMAPQNQEIDSSLASKSGLDFDKQYMNMMVSDHEKDIAAYQAGANTREADLNDFAERTLPMLKMHLDSAKAINSTMR